MKLYDTDPEDQGELVQSNQTNTQKAGSGFDVTFEDKFNKPETNFSAWS